VSFSSEEICEFPANYMKGALTLAKLALGLTSPNPAVGAVIVKQGVVVGMGYTQPPGSWHAEVMALQQAGAKARGATMYVTLEPCCHFGRTPPCTDAIIAGGIKDVHVATKDPNPVVAGKGIAALEEAGIRITVGELETEAREVNEAYLKYVTTGMPFVTAKVGMSLDGKIATRSGDSKWITGEESRRFVHELRNIVDAVMVGVNTVKTDNPRLTARSCSGKGGKPKKQPLRVIVDGRGSTPETAQVFREPGNTLVVLSGPVDKARAEAYRQVGSDVIELPRKSAGESLVDLEQLLRELGKREMTHILVEGGGKLVGSLFDANLIDRLIVLIAPIVIGGLDAPSPVGGKGIGRIREAFAIDRMTVIKSGNDIMISGYPRRPKVQENCGAM